MGYDVEQIRAQNPIEEVASRRGVQLHKHGPEFRGLCPFHNETSPSFTVFGAPGAQRWMCFGCQSHGDVIDFVVSYDRVDFQEACAILGGERESSGLQPEPRAAEVIVDVYAGYRAIRPPKDAALIVAGQPTPRIINPKRVGDPNRPDGASVWHPTLVHPYRDAGGNLLGYVLRAEIDGKKITPLVLWCETATGAGWTLGRFKEPRRLYGLDRLASRPGAQVWIVEGEKCADALQAAMPKVAVISWQGGGNGADKADWSPLRGRRVVLWPDNDGPGQKVMDVIGGLLSGTATEIKIIARDADKPKGWDCADAVADGWDVAGIIDWAKPRVGLWSPASDHMENPQNSVVSDTETGQKTPKPDPVPLSSPPETRTAPPSSATSLRTAQQTQPLTAVPQRSANVVRLADRAPVDPEDWRLGLVYNAAEEAKLVPSAIRNMILFLAHLPETKGVLGWNEFAQTIYINRKPPWPAAWTIPRHVIDTDVTEASGWLESKMLKPTVRVTGQAMMAAAKTAVYDPVRDYIHALKWDGCHRLDTWLACNLGAPDTPLNAAFGRCWMIGAVARILEPGCKMDTMIVLEGPQGKMKSSALRTLATWNGQAFFTDQISDIKSKDAAMEMQGVVVMEIAEMDALGRAETNAIKAWLSRQVDRFRPPYGSNVQEYPRHCVIAGTMNPSGNGWMKDATGGRRFWPVTVGDINLGNLARDRDQLWAEATAMYHAGEHWWLNREMEVEAGKVQASRREIDPWADAINNYLHAQRRVAMQDIIDSCLKIPASQQSSLTTKRISEHMLTIGWRSREIGRGAGVANGFLHPQEPDMEPEPKLAM